MGKAGSRGRREECINKYLLALLTRRIVAVACWGSEWRIRAGWSKHPSSMSIYTKDVVTQQADFGLSQRMSP